MVNGSFGSIAALQLIVPERLLWVSSSRSITQAVGEVAETIDGLSPAENVQRSSDAVLHLQ